ncbi:MAG: tRNA uridine-5-carboxymethylaminomethyl(34) synthesis enzyme MnmG, partial [Prevotellaceae bacterium]|nr:tRNA uridine-5-carboxymethylaminomethyl(34) synthesis enzyme MnmG [Prevotellaceae bacterium]
MTFSYDIIVIGGGHAGCEAACAAANLGSKTLLITMDMNKLAQMSCNPAVGGIAKGQIVREIDALGGQMGIITDRTAIQFRMLNRSKGPAMWSPRAQSDQVKFSQEWRKIIESTENLDIWQDMVSGFNVQDGKITGVTTKLNVTFNSQAVVLTAGTFLNGIIHIGSTQFGGGRMGDMPVDKLTEQLRDLGFKTDRMKTGTPVRIDGRSVDFSKLAEQVGENDFHKFSFLNIEPRPLAQQSCWIAYTNEKTHEVLRSGLSDSPLFNGQIKSIGPRYCPSIETKIVTFADKERHQLFLEPVAENSNEFYLNGFSSSLPLDIQLGALKTVEGFENVKIYRPGYAIEYDFFDPTQLKHSLETKKIEGLFFAGQVNGTTGYEEAGGQGLMAGINAHRKCVGKEPFILKRDEAYIGVLIDDLVTKGVDEPYRMFTSRAEYRILLRQDNADFRLTEKAFELGLATRQRYNLFIEKKNTIANLISFIENFSVKTSEINPFLESIGSSPMKQGCKLVDLVMRPELGILDLTKHIPALNEEIETIKNRKEEIIEATEILLKYNGYIEREQLIAQKLQRLE